MKQFNLNEYLANPSKKIITRDDRNVRIRCTDSKRGIYSILALVDNGDCESAIFYTKNGEYNIGTDHALDLFFVTEKHEGWVNIYEHSERGYEAGIIFDNEEDAKKYGKGREEYIATTKIEWEE